MAGNALNLSFKNDLDDDGAHHVLLLILAASNIPVVINDVSIYLIGTANTDPGIRFWLQKANDSGDGGTASGSWTDPDGITPVDARVSHTLQATVTMKATGTPGWTGDDDPLFSTNKAVWQCVIHPQTGIWRPPHIERPIVVAQGTRMVIGYNSAKTHNVVVNMEIEE